MSNVIHYPRSEGIDHKLVIIEDGIYQGSRITGFDSKILDEYKITQILSLTAVTVPPIKDICRWWLCKNDGHPWNSEQVGFVHAFAEFVIRTKSRFLIHCDHGNSRSSVGMVIWMMIKTFADKTFAYEWLKKKNPYANINQILWDSIPERL